MFCGASFQKKTRRNELNTVSNRRADHQKQNIWTGAKPMIKLLKNNYKQPKYQWWADNAVLY